MSGGDTASDVDAVALMHLAEAYNSARPSAIPGGSVLLAAASGLDLAVRHAPTRWSSTVQVDLLRQATLLRSVAGRVGPNGNRSSDGDKTVCWVTARDLAVALARTLDRVRHNTSRVATYEVEGDRRSVRVARLVSGTRDLARLLRDVRELDAGGQRALSSAHRLALDIEAVWLGPEAALISASIYAVLSFTVFAETAEPESDDTPEQRDGSTSSSAESGDANEPTVFSRRIEHLDAALRAATRKDFEPLLTLARRILDDPPPELEPESLVLMQSNTDTINDQLRSPDPDVIIVERAASRVILLVRPSHSEVADILVDSGFSALAAEETADQIDDLIEAAAVLGAADEKADVAQASSVERKRQSVELAVLAELEARGQIETDAGAARIRKREARLLGWEKFYSEVLPNHAGKAVVAAAGALGVAAGRLGTILQAVKAIVRFFAS